MVFAVDQKPFLSARFHTLCELEGARGPASLETVVSLLLWAIGDTGAVGLKVPWCSVDDFCDRLAIFCRTARNSAEKRRTPQDGMSSLVARRAFYGRPRPDDDSLGLCWCTSQPSLPLHSYVLCIKLKIVSNFLERTGGTISGPTSFQKVGNNRDPEGHAPVALLPAALLPAALLHELYAEPVCIPPRLPAIARATGIDVAFTFHRAVIDASRRMAAPTFHHVIACDSIVIHSTRHHQRTWPLKHQHKNQAVRN